MNLKKNKTDYMYVKSNEAIVDWVAEGFSYLQSHPERIEKSFSVCGME